MIYCEPCGCYVSDNILTQHNEGRKHLRKIAANGTTNTVPPHQRALLGLPNPDPRVKVSHEDGLDFVEGEGIEQVILIERTEEFSSLSFRVNKRVVGARTPASWCALFDDSIRKSHALLGSFEVSLPGETSVVRRRKPRRVLVSFQPPHAGTFHMFLDIIFNDSSVPSEAEFVVRRELRGRSTPPSSHVGNSRPRQLVPGLNRVDDRAARSTEDVLPDNQGGISVSHEDGVDFGIVDCVGLNGRSEGSSLVTISHAARFPAVTFVEARIISLDGSDSR